MASNPLMTSDLETIKSIYIDCQSRNYIVKMYGKILNQVLN